MNFFYKYLQKTRWNKISTKMFREGIGFENLYRVRREMIQNRLTMQKQ
jgi:hypothetical protein